MTETTPEVMPQPDAPVESPPEPPVVSPTPARPRKTGLWIYQLLFILLMIGGGMIGLAFMLMPGPLAKTTNVVIPRGSSVHEIAATLDKNGAVFSPFGFRLAAKVMAADSLKAGEYELTPEQSIMDIVIKMRDGQSIVRSFTIAEGLSSTEVANVLKLTTFLSGDITAIPAEGSLLPETYNYSYGDSRAGLIARMQKAMQEILTELWAKRDMSLPLKSPEQAVVMASIIEKETGKFAERPRIAAVFYNRLRNNMRLQSDPTVAYAITVEKGPMDHDLSHDDLSFSSPYNTYTSDGLPPHPICNPGRAALEAALHPEQNDFLYFVADGTGGHIFATGLAEHNQNVVRLREIRAAERLQK